MREPGNKKDYQSRPYKDKIQFHPAGAPVPLSIQFSAVSQVQWESKGNTDML